MNPTHHRQPDWLIIITWLFLLGFCVSFYVMLARLIAWAAT